MDKQTLFWYLVIKNLDQKDEEHIKIFDTLMETCQSSKKACEKIAKEVYQEYLVFCSKPQYIWREALDGWGGFYKGLWRNTDYKTTEEENDALNNSKILHKGSINDIFQLKLGFLCNDHRYKEYSLFSE